MLWPFLETHPTSGTFCHFCPSVRPALCLAAFIGYKQLCDTAACPGPKMEYAQTQPDGVSVSFLLNSLPSHQVFPSHQIFLFTSLSFFHIFSKPTGG